jgi:muramidase (phage lysozyme)
MKKTLLTIATILAITTIASCTPEQIQLYQTLPPEQQQAITQALAAPQTPDIKLNRTLVCIRQHESDRGPYPNLNGQTAQNPRSTASGFYQYLDGTWRNISAKAGYPGYKRAMYAPAEVQHAVAYYHITHLGTSAWRGSGC